MPVLRLVRNRLHQDALHFGRDVWIYLGWPRILAEIKDQQRIVLWIRAGKHMKHSSAERIDVRARFDLAGEQLWWRVAHRANSSHALLGRAHYAGYAKVDGHHSSGLGIEHQVCRLKSAVDDWRLLRVYTVKHVADLNCP